jgi:long-chain acyl-CoA synthetase
MEPLQDNAVDVTKYMSAAVVAGAALLGSAAYYYMSNIPSQKKLIDFDNQTRLIEGETEEIRVNTMHSTDKVLSYIWEDAKTCYDLFLKGAKISNDGNYIGWKPSAKEPFKWLSYSQAAKISEHVGSAFLNFGLEPSKENFVGIYARNRPEWVLTEQACNAYSLVSVPLYDTLGVEAISFILLQTEMKVVVCDDSDKAMSLMNSPSSIEYIVIVEKINEQARNKAEEKIKILSFEEVKEIGSQNLREPVPPKPEDLLTICYTSGTTGMPKGALITHANLIAIVSTMLIYVKDFTEVGKERYISYLPLAHMFERASQNVIISLGSQIAFYQGDIKKLADDLKEVKPTIFCTVPRLLNRIYAKVSENLENTSLLKRQIFKCAYAFKEREVNNGIIRNDGLADFAFKQIRESFGGCVKFIITGSAPMSPEILQFLRVVSGCHVLEGYGATETGGACGVQIPGESTVGHVGPPFLCSRYKLADVPEMGLIAKRDKKGEICVYGTNIFRGYFKDEEKTKSAIDSDGWYHTGDIGIFTDNGCMKIVDRVKNIFKLQQGEYIAPEKIENIYIRSKFVAQSFVYGNSYKSSLVAIVVPEESVLYEWAQENDLEKNMVLLCQSEALKKEILADILKLGKEGKLKGFEQVKDIYLHPELFSLENGLLTPTFKTKRNELQKYFQNQIDFMYKDTD